MGLASPTNAPAPGPSILVYIIIKTDYYPGDTSFKVTNQDGIEFMSGGDYTASLTQYMGTASLPNSNVYKFTIYDSYGDGICCTYGYGGYDLFVDGVIIKSGGVFSNSETITFPSNAPVTVPTNSPLASPTNAPAPGPSILVYIIIKTDYYPGDTSFKVTNQDG